MLGDMLAGGSAVWMLFDGHWEKVRETEAKGEKDYWLIVFIGCWLCLWMRVDKSVMRFRSDRVEGWVNYDMKGAIRTGGCIKRRFVNHDDDDGSIIPYESRVRPYRPAMSELQYEAIPMET